MSAYHQSFSLTLLSQPPSDVLKFQRKEKTVEFDRGLFKLANFDQDDDIDKL
jgi:hypothetical protein